MKIENLLKFVIAIAFLEDRWVSKLRGIILIPNNRAFPEVTMGDDIANDEDLFDGLGEWRL